MAYTYKSQKTIHEVAANLPQYMDSVEEISVHRYRADMKRGMSQVGMTISLRQARGGCTIIAEPEIAGLMLNFVVLGVAFFGMVFLAITVVLEQWYLQGLGVLIATIGAMVLVIGIIAWYCIRGVMLTVDMLNTLEKLANA